MLSNVTQAEVIEDAADQLHPSQVRDIPAIRQTINDTMDGYEKDGRLTRARSDRWSQERMVRAVQRRLKH